VFQWHGRYLDRKGSLEDDLLEGRQYFRDKSAVKMGGWTWNIQTFIGLFSLSSATPLIYTMWPSQLVHIEGGTRHNRSRILPR
jgi:hypothetical protein